MHQFLSTGVKLALFIFSLGIDTFTVAIALGISGIGKKGRLKVGLSFALFEGFMPLAGFLLGHSLSNVFGNIASIIGILILFGVGIWMIREAFSKEEKNKKLQIDTKKGLILTSLSVSMDELAVGFSMGTLRFPILLTVILIAFQAFILTFIGTAFGNSIGEAFAEKAEVIAGIVLCGLALLFLFETFAV